MEGHRTEPRTALWAVAEVCWEDQTGTPNQATATLEDTSVSGACIRLKKAITVGSTVSVKWHRGQFSAIARNCRSDGKDFLLGVWRSADQGPKEPALKEAGSSEPGLSEPRLSEPRLNEPGPPEKTTSSERVTAERTPATRDANQKSVAPGSTSELDRPSGDPEVPAGASPSTRREPFTLPRPREKYSAKSTVRRGNPARRSQAQLEGAFSRRERKVMPSKGFFPNLWRKQEDADAPQKLTSTEAPPANSQPTPAEGLTGPQTILLSYEDIYRAAGILSPRSGYGIHKVVDMLNSDRIRNLSPDIKRASVLMALDAAGTSADDLLQDATRRQQALRTYEAGQQKQLEEFEARKSQENAQIQAEMERVTAHYAERIQQNHNLVGKEKEALRNWQMQKQYENERISEVIELCGKQIPAKNASASTSHRVPAERPGNSPALPNSIPEVSMGR
jgi:hypothetical protein